MAFQRFTSLAGVILVIVFLSGHSVSAQACYAESTLAANGTPSCASTPYTADVVIHGSPNPTKGPGLPFALNAQGFCGYTYTECDGSQGTLPDQPAGTVVFMQTYPNSATTSFQWYYYYNSYGSSSCPPLSNCNGSTFTLEMTPLYTDVYSGTC